MSIEIRTVPEDRFADVVRATALAFGGDVSEADLEHERSMTEFDRQFAAFDGDEIVAGAAAFTMLMTIPGGETTVGYVTGVGVVPSHRRRGVNTALMRRQIDDAHERGETIEVLYASEGGIYGRYGYGLATLGMAFDAEAAHTAFVRGYEPSGAVSFVDRDAAIPRVLEVLEGVRPDIPGMVSLTATSLGYTLHDYGPDKELPSFFAFHETDGRTDGYAIYRIRHDWRDSVPRSTLAVRDLQAVSAGAAADLWRFVFDVDLVETLEAWSRPTDDPVLHLVQEPRRLHAKLRDGLWIRLVDVARALAERRYVAAGRVVVEVTDAFCPWNDGRYALEASEDGSATCERSDADPELRCSVTELASAYLGGFGFRRLARAGLVEELREGALARADAMFAWDREPWCPYLF